MMDGLQQRKLGVRDIGYWRFGLLVILLISVIAFIKYRQWTLEHQPTLAQEKLQQVISAKQKNLNEAGRTGSYFNGRAWQEMGDSKTLWVIGFNEGILNGVSRSAKPKSDDELNNLCEHLMIPKNYPYAVVVSEINKLYENKSNLSIPIAWAFNWTIAKIGGVSSDELQRHLVNLRRMADENFSEVGK